MVCRCSLFDSLCCYLIMERVRPGFVFFFNDTATTEIYTLSLHDALPISVLDPDLPRCAGHLAVGVEVAPRHRQDESVDVLGHLGPSSGKLSGTCDSSIYQLRSRRARPT